MSDHPTTPTHPDHKTDAALEDTFPASDAPNVTPPAGSRKAEQVEPKPAGESK